MPLPTFLIIGAGRSGTTALHYQLMQHPDVFMCPVKEPAFFAFEGGPDVPDDSLGFAWPGDQAAARATMHALPPSQQIFDLATYETLFQGVTTERAIGEATPKYLYNPRAPERIRHHLPDVRLIAVLRQPVERAFSQYVQHVRNGHVRLGDFVQTLEEEAAYFQHQCGGSLHYLRHGFYGEQLARYYALFPASQIRVYRYEDFDAHRPALLRDLMDFIGVDPDFLPPPPPRINASGLPRSRMLDRVLRGPVRLKRTLKMVLPATAQHHLAQLQNRLQNRNLTRIALPDTLRRSLTRQYYQEDLMRLQALTGLHVDDWLR